MRLLQAGGMFCAGMALSVLALADANIDEVPIGENLTGPLTIGKNTYPLPPGEWTLINLATWNYNIGNKKVDDIKGLILAKIRDRQLLETIYIESPVNNSGLESDLVRVERNPCNNEFVYFRQDMSSDKNFPECIGVSYSTNFLRQDKPNKWLETLQNYFVVNKIDTPFAAVHADYHYASKAGVVSFMYAFNPEITGIAPAKIANWNDSEWSKGKLDDAKKQFRDRTISWTKQMGEAMHKSTALHERTTMPDLME